MAGGAPAGGSTVFSTPPCRSIWTKVLPGAAANYNTEEPLTGWFNIKAVGDDAYVYFGHGDKWGRDNEGVMVTQNETITRRLDDMPLGYYTARGTVRLEKIEFVKLED